MSSLKQRSPSMQHLRSVNAEKLALSALSPTQSTRKGNSSNKATPTEDDELLHNNCCDDECAQCIPLDKLQPRNFKQSEGKRLVVVVACGSFSPITVLHLRMFEAVRDYLTHEKGEVDIIGGIVSPVHDAYGKQSLIPQCHRTELARAALHATDWVSVCEWETHQRGWSRTKLVLQRYQEALNKRAAKRYGPDAHIGVRLLCGADLLESFQLPGVWSEADKHFILAECGVTVLERDGCDLAAIIEAEPALRKYKQNIHIVKPYVVNDISSTVVRGLIRRNLSIRVRSASALATLICVCFCVAL
jgi:nicotinamide mononucleotide adenylyltransferase